MIALQQNFRQPTLRKINECKAYLQRNITLLLNYLYMKEHLQYIALKQLIQFQLPKQAHRLYQDSFLQFDLVI